MARSILNDCASRYCHYNFNLGVNFAVNINVIADVNFTVNWKLLEGSTQTVIFDATLLFPSMRVNLANHARSRFQLIIAGPTKSRIRNNNRLVTANEKIRFYFTLHYPLD